MWIQPSGTVVKNSLLCHVGPKHALIRVAGRKSSLIMRVSNVRSFFAYVRNSVSIIFNENFRAKLTLDSSDTAN